MKTISRADPKYALDQQHEPTATVRLGESFIVETHDCRTGTITSADQVDQLRDTRFVNPATGPIYIEGVAAGDCIRIDVERLRIDSSIGLMLTRPGTTALQVTDAPQLRIVRCEGGVADVGAFRVPIEPMIGVVGVAPARDPVSTFYGGDHGGNMDTRLIGAGSRVYLRAFHDGAGIYFGDVHAAMGDGEVFLSGIEIAGNIQARVTIADGWKIPTPCIVTSEVVALIAAGDTVDDAARGALQKGLDALRAAGMDPVDAGYLMSAGGHLRISQYLPLSGLVHCRFELPISLLSLNGFVMPGLVIG